MLWKTRDRIILSPTRSKLKIECRYSACPIAKETISRSRAAQTSSPRGWLLVAQWLLAMNPWQEWKNLNSCLRKQTNLNRNRLLRLNEGGPPGYFCSQAAPISQTLPRKSFPKRVMMTQVKNLMKKVHQTKKLLTVQARMNKVTKRYLHLRLNRTSRYWKLRMGRSNLKQKLI